MITVLRYVLLTCLQLQAILAGHEVMRLVRGNDYICIMDQTDQPVYLDPPGREKAKNTTRLETNQNLFPKDWSLKHYSEFPLGPVTDKRWEDFETIYTNYSKFDFVKSVAFSLYEPTQVEFFIVYTDKFRYVRNILSEESRSLWFHYNIVTDDNNTYIFENNKLLSNFSKVVPTQVIVKTSGNYWKIHDYKLGVSQEIVGTANVIVPPSNISCMMLYVALCPYCQLYVIDRGASKLFHLNGNEIEPYYSWKNIKVETSQPLQLIVRTNKDTKFGFWGIDTTKCPNLKFNKVIYKASLNPEEKELDRECRLLNHHRNKLDD